MRIKTNTGKKKEVVLLSVASFLTVLLIIYFVWLVNHISGAAQGVFSVLPRDVDAIPAFNFDKYNRVVAPLFNATSSRGGPIAPPSTASTTRN